MTCDRLDLPGGGTAIVCTRGKRGRSCKVCGRRATRECDFPITPRGGTPRTCDAPLCGQCAKAWTRDLALQPAATPAPGDTLDLCPAHHAHAKSPPPGATSPRAPPVQGSLF